MNGRHLHRQVNEIHISKPLLSSETSECVSGVFVSFYQQSGIERFGKDLTLVFYFRLYPLISSILHSEERRLEERDWLLKLTHLFVCLFVLFKHICHCLPPKTPRLIKGAYNNTIIRLKIDRHKQHTKLQQIITRKVLIKQSNSGHRKAISINY